MIKFFRNIRQALLVQHKTWQYLKYATGEIVPVIGILIALKINNWNDEIKNYKAETLALIELKQEFINTAQLFEKNLALKRTRIQQWEEVIQNVTKTTFKSAGEYRPPSGSATFFPSQNTPNKLLFTGKIDNLKNDSLKNLLDSWSVRLADYQDDEKLHREFWYGEFHPYKRGILAITMLPSDFSGQPSSKEWGNPFYSETERKQLLLNAYSDLKYQNLILENRQHLLNVVLEGDELQMTLSQIIELLVQEIAAHIN